MPRGLPGMFAPVHHEFVLPTMLRATRPSTSAVQTASASGSASMRSKPRSTMWARQSAIQSTCCSIDSMTLLNTAGLPGPVIMNRFGNPEATRPM